jgi:2-iminobutanoate/2-iminopropanoate deaminase
MRTAIRTENAPSPVGPYSQAVVEGNFIFVSGQGPLDPKTGTYTPADIRTETKRVLENMKAILEAAGSSLDKVVKCMVLLRDIEDFAAMNEVYASYFETPGPARTTFQAGALPLGISVEIDCIASV